MAVVIAFMLVIVISSGWVVAFLVFTGVAMGITVPMGVTVPMKMIVHRPFVFMGMLVKMPV